jgi:hypothetical protein
LGNGDSTEPAYFPRACGAIVHHAAEQHANDAFAILGCGLI